MDDEHRRTDKEITKIERKLGNVYSQASQEAQKRYEQFMGKFARLDEVKRQQVEKGEISEEEYLTWRKNKIAMSQNYKDMVDALTNDMVNANQIAASIVGEHLPEVYASNFNYATYQIEHDAKVDTSFTLYDRSTVERLIRDNPDIIPIKPKVDVPRDRLWNKQKINGAVTQSILQGESIPDASKRLKSVAEMNNTAAVRTARTAITAAESSGRVDSYKRAQDMGIDLRQQWLATLDSRTRHSHRVLDGESIPVAKDKQHPSKFSNGLRYPGDPQGPGYEIYNCRCTLIADVEGVDQGAIDDLSLRNNSKLGDMSYEEWKGEVDSVKTPSLHDMIKADSAKFSGLQENALLYYADNGKFPKGISAYQKKKLQGIIDEYNKGIQGRGVQLTQVTTTQPPKLPTAEQFKLPNETRDVADRWVKDEHIVQQYSGKQLQAMETYMMESDDINGALRGYSDYFDSSIARTLSSCMTEYTAPECVFRGIDGAVLDIHEGDSIEAIRNKLVGKSYTEKGFMSTSRAVDVAHEFSERGAFDSFEAERPCVLVLDVQGSKVAYLNSGLAEVLLDKGSVITYTDVAEENGVLKVFGKVTQKSRK